MLGVMIWCVWAAHTIPEPSTCQDFPPTLPLLPPSVIPVSSAPPPLLPVSPSAPTQPSICAVGSPQVCQTPPASWLEDPLSLPPASESQTPPRPVDPEAPPWLLAPSSPPWPVSPPAPLGSLVPPALPWSVVDHPPLWDYTHPGSPHLSIPLAPSGSTFPPAPPWYSVAPDPSLHLGCMSHLLGLGRILPVALSPLRTPPPPAPPPSVIPLESSCHSSTMAPPSISSTVGHLPSPPAPGSSLAPPSVRSSLAPPSVITTLDSVCRPPPGHPATSWSSSCLSVPAFCHPSAVSCPFLLRGTRLRLPEGGELSQSCLNLTCLT